MSRFNNFPFVSFSLTVAGGLLAGFFLIALAMLILAQLATFSVSQRDVSSIFMDSSIMRITGFTFYQAGLSTLISIALGVVLSWSLANRPQFPLRAVLIALISSTFVLPVLVVILGIVTVYGRNGWLAALNHYVSGESLPFSIYGLSGILLAHVFFNASFSTLILLRRLEAVPDETRKLGFALGMDFWRKIRVIDWPAIKSTLPGLSITIFLICFTSFAIVLTLGGSPAYNTLEVAIYEAVRFDFDLPHAFQLAMTQIVICFLLSSLVSIYPVPEAPSLSAVRLADYEHLVSYGERSFQNFSIVLFSIFFITPLLAVVFDGLGSQFPAIFLDPVFVRALFSSLVIAAVSTLLALILSFSIASAIVALSDKERGEGTRMARFMVSLLSFSSMLYLVFPALVMGLGFFLLFRKTGGNPVIWAVVIIIIANALIAIPFAVTGLRPVIWGAARKNDRLCLSLGLGRWQRWRKVDWPVLRSSIAYVAALSFCFSLGDLGVIALFGNNEFKTLPWLLYQKFGSYRTQDASAIALVLLILTTGIFSLACKFSGKVNSTISR